jgi:hypothetical protein
MFLHCVALDQAEVAAPWRKYSGATQSLFWFRVVLGCIGIISMLPLLAGVGVAILRMVLRGEPDVAGVMLGLVMGLGFFLLAIIFALIHKLLLDFVVPIMALRGTSCLAAGREFSGLLAAHLGQFVWYLLFQFVLAMAIGIIVLMAILLTCCIAGCFLMLPFIGTVLLLPVLVFKRAYSLYFLAQFGAEYDVFPLPPVPPLTSDSPLQPLA